MSNNSKLSIISRLLLQQLKSGKGLEVVDIFIRLNIDSIKLRFTYPLFQQKKIWQLKFCLKPVTAQTEFFKLVSPDFEVFHASLQKLVEEIVRAVLLSAEVMTSGSGEERGREKPQIAPPPGYCSQVKAVGQRTLLPLASKLCAK